MIISFYQSIYFFRRRQGEKILFKHFVKFMTSLLCLVILVAPNNTMFAKVNASSNNVKEPAVSAVTAILIDSKTGRILYNKKAYNLMYPASTTKTLTALLAIENLNLDKVIVVPYNACKIPCDSSTVGIKPGEKIKIRYLLYALMLDSANECANILAEQVSGSVKAFAVKMNQSAKQLGAISSNFVNPSGYPDIHHHTTAYDLSKIAVYAMKNPVFRKIVGTYAYKIPPTNKHPKGIFLSNTNRLINKKSGGKYFYPYAIGIKTGTSNSSGKVLVSCAKKGNIELIAVVMKSADIYGDSIKLFNYGFANPKH